MPEKPPDFESFTYKGHVVHPPAAYTDGWKQHIANLASNLGEPYLELWKYIGYEYYRYVLWNIKDKNDPLNRINKIITKYKEAGCYPFWKKDKL